MLRLEIRTAAGPASTLQWVFNGGPYIGGAVYVPARRRRVGTTGAVPSRVPAAVTSVGDVADEDLAAAELMTGWATVRWFRDPRASRGA
jgi:hypothetical protein